MASQLENGFDCIKHCCGVVHEQKSTVNSVRADDWTAELPTIASNDNFFQEIGLRSIHNCDLIDMNCCMNFSVHTFTKNRYTAHY